ncbi:hypothetical protein V2J09_022939 [Rumex salicifolius]
MEVTEVISIGNTEGLLMADIGLKSPSPQKKLPSSFLFGFTAFASKSLTDSEPVMSPTSILDTKPFSALKNPFWTESNSPKSIPKDPSFDNTKPRNGCPKFDTEGVGLGIIDSLAEEKLMILAKKPENSSRLLLFGSQLKIQIPTPHTNFAVDSPNSPMEFGIKTKNSHLSLVSPSTKCSNLGPETPNSPWSLNGSISTAEMELSEDYTCVISRGGHVTKTTRIFDDCVVDSCFCDAVASSSSPFAISDENMVSVSPDLPTGYSSESFLSFCHACKKNLDHGKDIYMYRGEKAFCSDECRHQEMIMEEMKEKNGFESWPEK